MKKLKILIFLFSLTFNCINSQKNVCKNEAKLEGLSRYNCGSIVSAVIILNRTDWFQVYAINVCFQVLKKQSECNKKSDYIPDIGPPSNGE